MHLVLMIAGGILLAILVLPLLGIAIPIAITIGLCAGILFSFAFLAFFIRDTIQERRETKERLSKMSEEDRAAEIEKMKVKKKTTIMAWIITGILIIVPFLLAQIMAFYVDV